MSTQKICKWLLIAFLTLFLLWTLSHMSSPPPLLLTSTRPLPLPSGHHHTVFCVYELSVYVLGLIPSSSFIHSRFLFLWQLPICSMYPYLCFFFFLQFIFVHQILHISEIIWYLHFFLWLAISLTIIISRSIHAVSKGKISFLIQPCVIPLCKCTTAFLSCLLLMGSFICDGSQTGNSQISCNRWMVKQTLVYPKYWILLIQERYQLLITNFNRSQRHHTE